MRRNAAAHIPLSRLQLALQGLESTAPRIRIAVLGLNVQDTARKIVRLLLADPLEPQARWEQDLIDDNTRNAGGLLIRYGQPANPNLSQSNTSVPVLEIPSPLLERANIEVLISAVSGPTAHQQRQIPVDTFLAPVIGTPSASSGRHTIISQPVHRALVVVKGLEELLHVAELLASTEIISDEDKASIRIVMQQNSGGVDGQVLTIDPSKAEEGLQAIRSSLSRATEFEHKTVESGLPNLSKWLSSCSKSEDRLPQAVTDLVSAVLQSASASLQAQAKKEASIPRTDLATITNLSSTIDDFSRNAHQELQSGLASAWSSRNWRKLAWYKLFWRVDDVGLIVTDLISNAWLPRTERAVYELSGRLAQAGISPMEMIAPPVEVQKATLPEEVSPSTAPLPVLQAQAVAATDHAEPVILNNRGTATIELQPTPQLTPLSASVSATRAAQIQRAIVSLSSTAQQLVFRTLSITGLSAGLSGLTYFSLTPGSLYEAGTIVALGTAFALWRMQGGWQAATKGIEDELYDEGRTAIRRITGRMQVLVEDKARPRVDQAKQLKFRMAVESVARAREELSKLLQESGGKKR